MFDICKNCGTRISPTKGFVKTIRTEQQAEFLSIRTKKQFFINDKLCDKCRRILLQDKSTNVQETSVSSSSTSANTSDSDFVFAEQDTITLNIQRVTASERRCIICNSEDGRNRIPIEARRQAYNECSIFIPEGCRCCPSHLVNNQFFRSQLRNLQIVNSTTTMASSEIEKCLKALS